MMRKPGLTQGAVNFSVSDALAKIPGVSQITTGSGISNGYLQLLTKMAILHRNRSFLLFNRRGKNDE